MTKEAKELVDQLYVILSTMSDNPKGLDMAKAKDAAIFCVDEKIKLLREIREEIGLDISHIERQEKMKSEIEKL